MAAAAMTAMLGGASIAAAQPAPPQADAAEAPIDADQLALARRLMHLLSSQMNFDAVMNNMIAGMMPAIHQQNPNLDQATLDQIQGAVQKAMAGITPDLLDDVAKLYAQRLTRREMEDSIAFYESPSGQSMMHKMPEIMGDIGPLMTKYVPRIEASMIKALCDQDACTEEQRKALTSRVLMSHGG
jgi:hypothetical protein